MGRELSMGETIAAGPMAGFMHDCGKVRYCPRA